MSKLTELQAQIAELQALAALYNTFPPDIYNLGTVALFTANNNATKWYYEKVGEEQWRRLASGGDTEFKPLADWIYVAKTTTSTYFEVYIMTPGNAPIYASA